MTHSCCYLQHKTENCPKFRHYFRRILAALAIITLRNAYKEMQANKNVLQVFVQEHSQISEIVWEPELLPHLSKWA